MEYNDDFERRRAYISSREKMRKRRRTVYLTILFMVLAALFLLVGGVLLGIIEILSKAYISSQLSDAIVFSVLIIVLLVRPTGILGKKLNEKV